MNRYFSSFVITALIYTFIAYLFFIYASSTSFVKKAVQKPKVISLSHVQLVPELRKEVKKEAKKPIIPINPIKEVRKQKVKKTVKKKIVKKKNLVKKKVAKKRQVKRKVPRKKLSAIKNTKKVVQKKTTTLKPNKPQKVVKQDIKKLYLAKNLRLIRNQIQKYIKYPKRAKRFGLEDIVRVRFKLLANGKIVDVVLIKGHKLFKKPTIKAIQKASFKFPKVQKAITIELPIEYKLI